MPDGLALTQKGNVKKNLLIIGSIHTPGHDIAIAFLSFEKLLSTASVMCKVFKQLQGLWLVWPFTCGPVAFPFARLDTLIIKRTLYMQKFEAPKVTVLVTLGILFWTPIKHFVEVWKQTKVAFF